jgi:hypothetical protein
LKDNKENLVCANCGSELEPGIAICPNCDNKLKEEKVNTYMVPLVILMLISFLLGLFLIWDIVFVNFSGTVLRVCEIDYSRELSTKTQCQKPTYQFDKNISYYIEISSSKNGEKRRVDFNEYPILFNKDNYKRLFKKLKTGDYIKKSYFSPYYIVNKDTYVLIGSPIQVILLASIFLILIPVLLPKFIKDFARDNKHLGKVKFRR